MKPKRLWKSKFICLDCEDDSYRIWRNRQRPKWHIKALYCPICGRTTDHLELREGTTDIYEYYEDPERYMISYVNRKESHINRN